MSLSHLGKDSEPVFDAILPSGDELFPVARRVVSHAARSLFAGKLLFPVETAGKEGQHCFTDVPKRLFRFLSGRKSPSAPFRHGIHHALLSFHATDLKQTIPGPTFFMPARKLESASRDEVHVIQGRFDLDHSLLRRDSAGLVLALPRWSGSFSPPLLAHQIILSRYELARLRRLSAESESEKLAKSMSPIHAASVVPGSWDLHAWPLKERPDRQAFRSKQPTVPILTPPGPALMIPITSSVSKNIFPVATFRTELFGFKHDWNPTPFFRIKPQIFVSSPHRTLIHGLLKSSPRFGPIDGTCSIPLIIYHGPWTNFHSTDFCFHHVSRQIRPDSHEQTGPVFPSVQKLPQPETIPSAVSSIVATVSRSRLARMEGKPHERMFRTWPRKVFTALRRLRFNQSGFRNQLFAGSRSAPFASLVSEPSVAIHDTPERGAVDGSGSLSVSWRSDAHPISRSLPGASATIVALLSEGFMENNAGPASFIFSPPLPAPVILAEPLLRSDSHLPIARPRLPGNANRGQFQNTGFTRLPKRLSDSGYTPPRHCSETRQPVNPMILLASGNAARGPRPLAIPRRLPQPFLQIWMTLAGSSLPRRTSATRHYLLTLEPSLAAWKQHPQLRRSKFSIDRRNMPVNAFEPLASLSMTAAYTTESPVSVDDIQVIAATPARAVLTDHIYTTQNYILCGRSAFQVSPASTPAHVAGVTLSAPPEWLRPGRQVRMKVRYWPTFYSLAPISEVSHVSSLYAPRSAMQLKDRRTSVAFAPGAFGLFRQNRPSGPFSLRQPRRWLWDTGRHSSRIPDAYPHEVSLLSSSPSRLDSSARIPPAFTGPAFRAPWQDVRRTLETVTAVPLEISSPPPIDRLPFNLSSARPRLSGIFTLPEVPMPRCLTEARPPGFSHEVQTWPVLSGAPSLPSPEMEMKSSHQDPSFVCGESPAMQVNAFLELSPDRAPEAISRQTRHDRFNVQEQAIVPNIYPGSYNARWRNLKFPYSPADPDPGCLPVLFGDSGIAEPQIHPADSLDELFFPCDTLDQPSIEPDPATEFCIARKELCPVTAYSVPSRTDTKSPPPSENPAIRPPPRISLQKRPEQASPVLPSNAAYRSPIFDSISVSSPAAFLLSDMQRASAYAAADVSARTSSTVSDPPQPHMVIMPGRWRRRVSDPTSFAFGPSPTHTEATVSGFETVLSRSVSCSCCALPPGGVPQALRFPLPGLKPCGTSHPRRIALISDVSDEMHPSSQFPPAFVPASGELSPRRYHPRSATKTGTAKMISSPLPSLDFELHLFLALPPIETPPWEFAERSVPSKPRTSLPRKLSLKMSAIPDWIELQTSRPSCRPDMRL